LSRRRRRNIFDEFEEIDRQVDEFFGRVFSGEPMWDIQERTLKPLYEVKETKGSVMVMVDLPYVEKDDIDLKVNEESIDLSAELCQPVKYDHWGTAQRDCEFRRLSTTIRLPAQVIPDGAVARFKEGVLTVELPKKMKRTRIPVQ
jgi:HSP20 family protein